MRANAGKAARLFEAIASHVGSHATRDMGLDFRASPITPAQSRDHRRPPGQLPATRTCRLSICYCGRIRGRCRMPATIFIASRTLVSRLGLGR